MDMYASAGLPSQDVLRLGRLLIVCVCTVHGDTGNTFMKEVSVLLGLYLVVWVVGRVRCVSLWYLLVVGV